MCDLTSGLFQHLDTTSSMEVDQSIDYTQCILRGLEIKKYKAVLIACKESEEDIAGDKWTLGDLKELYIYGFWTWVNSYRLDSNRYAYLGLEKCVNF